MRRARQPRRFVAAMTACVLLFACNSESSNVIPAIDSQQATGMSEPQASPDGSSGVYGALSPRFGNMPAQVPPPSECVRVLDANGATEIAKGVCSGVSRQFRVALPPGSYVVEAGGEMQGSGDSAHFVPKRYPVEVQAGRWIEVATPPNRGPVP